MSRVLYFISGRSSAIWRELSQTAFADVDVIFVDRYGNILREDSTCLESLDELNTIVGGREVCFLHFSAATPNNSAGMARDHFERFNYEMPKHVIDILSSSNASLIYHLNFSTTAMFDRASPEPLLTMASPRVNGEDYYGYTKLLYWLYLDSLAKHTDKLSALTLVCPVLLGQHVQGNFLSNVIRDVRANVAPTVANLDNEFNAVFPVRYIPSVIDSLLRKVTNSNVHITLLGGATRRTSVRRLLRVLGAENFNLVDAKFPPKLIDVMPLVSYVGLADIDIEKELAFYTQGVE